MNNVFHGPVASELHGFLQFKRSLGYGYARAEFALRESDRFLSEYAAKDQRWQLDRAAIAWLSSKPKRKAVTVSGDAAILRQFFGYLADCPTGKLWNRSGRNCPPSPPSFRIFFPNRTF